MFWPHTLKDQNCKVLPEVLETCKLVYLQVCNQQISKERDILGKVSKYFK